MLPLDSLKEQTTRDFQLLLSQFSNWMLSQTKKEGSYYQGASLSMYLSRIKEQLKAQNPKADSFKDCDDA